MATGYHKELSLDLLHTHNEQALTAATNGYIEHAHRMFQNAWNIAAGLNETDPGNPEVLMASSTTLRDWGMTYARDAAVFDGSEDPHITQQSLFEASDYVFDLAKRRAVMAIDATDAARGIATTQKAQQYLYIVSSVEARAHTLKAVVTDQPMPPEYGYTLADNELNPGYWRTANDMHAAADSRLFSRGRNKVQQFWDTAGWVRKAIDSTLATRHEPEQLKTNLRQLGGVGLGLLHLGLTRRIIRKRP